MRHTAKDRPSGGLLLYIYLYLCPVNVFKSFKIQDPRPFAFVTRKIEYKHL